MLLVLALPMAFAAKALLGCKQPATSAVSDAFDATAQRLSLLHKNGTGRQQLYNQTVAAQHLSAPLDCSVGAARLAAAAETSGDIMLSALVWVEDDTLDDTWVGYLDAASEAASAADMLASPAPRMLAAPPVEPAPLQAELVPTANTSQPIDSAAWQQQHSNTSIATATGSTAHVALAAPAEPSWLVAPAMLLCAIPWWCIACVAWALGISGTAATALSATVAAVMLAGLWLLCKPKNAAVLRRAAQASDNGRLCVHPPLL